jgi:hypothetical protein
MNEAVCMVSDVRMIPPDTRPIDDAHPKRLGRHDPHGIIEALTTIASELLGDSVAFIET